MPSGQEIDITDQPVTTASKTQPARRADGWKWDTEERVNKSKNPKKYVLFFYGENKDYHDWDKIYPLCVFREQSSLLFSGRLHM